MNSLLNQRLRISGLLLFIIFFPYLLNAVAPAAPLGLTAASSSATEIKLSWIDNANDETGFVVERSANGSGDWDQIALLTENFTSYNDNTVGFGEKWYYRVYATNASGNSGFSNVFSAIAYEQLPPVFWSSGGDSFSDLQKVVWDGSKFVGVGSNGDISLSLDGMSWSPQNSGISESLLALAWNGSIFVAVGYNGVLLTSPDGIAWTTRSSGTNELLSDVEWNGSQFVVVGGDGVVLTSLDGTTWSMRMSGTTEYLSDIEWNGSFFIVVGDDGVILTSSDGVTWLFQDGGEYLCLSSVAWNGSRFVVTGHNGIVITSPDGVEWTHHSGGSYHTLRSLFWNGSQFIASGFDHIYTSYDGIKWFPEGGMISEPVNSIAWNGSRLVAVGMLGSTYVSTGSNLLPLAAKNLVAAASSSQEIELSWVDSNERDDANYIIERSANGLSGWVQVGVTMPNATRFSDTFVNPGEYWFYRVKAINQIGNGGYSNVYESVAFEQSPGDVWSKQSRLPTNATLRNLVWNGSGFFVKGSWVGYAFVSENGTDWKDVSSDSFLIYMDDDIIWDGKQYVAVSRSGSISTSPDAVNWTYRHTTNGGDGDGFHVIGWNGSVYTIIGAGSVSVSRDAINWTEYEFPFGDIVNDIVWANGQFVAVGYDVVLTSPDGVTWTQQPVSVSDTILGVCWSGSKLVAVGTNGLVMTSVDAITWTKQVSGSAMQLNRVVWNGSLFVAVGGGSWNDMAQAEIITSPDGISWNRQNSEADFHLSDIEWNGSMFVSTGVYGSIVTSCDGVTWESQSIGFPDSLRRVKWNGNSFIAVGDSGFSQGSIAVSSDGVIWSRKHFGMTNQFNDIAWNDSLHVVVGNNGVVMSSSDTISWTVRSSGIAENIISVVWDGMQFIAKSYNGHTLVSSDGVVWVLDSTGAIAFTDIAWNGSLYMGVNANGIFSSSDGIVWAHRYSGRSFYGIEWGNGTFVAVGDGGVICTSYNGIRWDYQVADTTVRLSDVVWNGAIFVAVGWRGALLASTDAVSWSDKSFTGIDRDDFQSIAWNGSQFVVVGELGSVLKSLGQNYSIVSYSEWTADSDFGSLDSSGLGDPDNDGVINLFEYALNFDPIYANDLDGLPLPIASGSNLEFTFFRARLASKATYTVQTSTDLVNWVDEFVNPGTVGQSVTVSKPIPVYMRLKVDVH